MKGNHRKAVIDLAIQQLHALLRSGSAGPMLEDATAVEWWAHCRRPGDPHQLHFDVDERRLRQGRTAYSLHHPIASSVLYLSDHGGPTLVIDQTASLRGLGSTGWAVSAACNRLLLFKGDLLHGVLPGEY